MPKKRVIYVSGDHAGFKYKIKVKEFLKKQGYQIVDYGPLTYRKDDDYPEFVIPMAKQVAKTKNSRGIIMAGSGEGEIIAANRIPGVRAVLYYGHKDPKKILKLSRAHNDSNILSLGSRFLTEKQAIDAIKIWLKAPFSNATRHKRRLRKLEKYSRN